MPTPEDVAKALRDLEAAGAKVHDSQKEGKKITEAVLSDLQKGASPQFDAWVSWSKSF